MDGKHLVLSCTLASHNTSISSYALIDSGASGNGFIDESYASCQNLPLKKLYRPRQLEVVDGRPVASGQIKYYVEVAINISGHEETTRLYVTTLGHYPIVLGIPWLQRHNVKINWQKHLLQFDSPYCLQNCTSNPVMQYGITSLVPERPYIAIMNLYEFEELATKEELMIMEILPVDISKKLPPEYQDFASVFDKKEASQLPPYRAIDHEIPLESGKQPPWKLLYSMSQNELEALQVFLKENLEKGFIRPSSSPARAPVLFVKKKDGTLRLCVDYRGLNEITVKNRYPLPLIEETLDRIGKAKIYTKLDMRGAYNLIRIKPGEEWKTAFGTRYGHFEFLVMPFGLTNAPATFQNFVNDILRNHLDDFCSAYLDDVLVFSPDKETHVQHVRTILDLLKKNNIYCKLEKSDFHTVETEYLGFIITPGGTAMNPDKVKTIIEWSPPTKVKHVQSFLGFANFYRRFIYGYSRIAAPLTRLTGKDIPWNWDRRANVAFETLKRAFTTAPILRHFDF